MTNIQLVLLLIVWGVCIWALICNFRTGAQRHSLINLVFRDDDDGWRARLVHLDAVSYERHLWQLMTLRDPAHLYPAEWNGGR